MNDEPQNPLLAIIRQQVVEEMQKYPIQEFLADFSILMSLKPAPKSDISSTDADTIPQAFRDYYQKSYGVGSFNEGNEKIDRVVAAYNYLRRHVSEFDSGGIAVVGKSGGLISRYLQLAFYRVFISLPIYEIRRDFPASILIKLAEEEIAEGKSINLAPPIHDLQ